MHYNDGLHDGQRISHMQGIATSLTPLAELPPPIRSEPEHRTAEVTSGQEPEPSLDGQTRNQPGSLEEGRMKPRSPDDGSETEKDHAEDFIRVSAVGLGDDRSDAGAFDVNDVLGMVPSSRGGLPCDLRHPQAALTFLPNELVFHILSFLDVCDLLSTSRVNRLLRRLSLAPLLHRYRLQRNRILLPPLLGSPCRPSLAELIARSIFLTKTSVVSRRLGRSLVSIRLSRRLAARPSVEALVDRAVLPKECVPGMAPVHVAPALVAKRKAIEKERTKDTLRRWVGAKWKGEVRVREEDVRRMEESRGVGRVWRLRRFWERVSRGDIVV